MCTFLFQSSNHSILLLGRSRYEEIANLSEDEDGKEDVAKATEDGTVLPIILRLQLVACLFKVWEPCMSCVTSYEHKSMNQVN